MRELELSITDAIHAGIVPYKNTPIGTPMLEQLLGFRCGKFGVSAYEFFSNNLPPDVVLNHSWPFPQALSGELYRLIVIRDDFSGSDYVYSIASDYSTGSLIATIPILGPQYSMMEMADFGLFSFITNGTQSHFFSPPPPLGSGSWEQVTFPNTYVPLMRTVCNYKGQVVGGNIANDWYDCDETYIVWSNIGHFDFALTLRNEAGYRRCPFGGVVRNVRRLNDSVICYSSEGVSALIPVIEPAPTFGLNEVTNVGILNQNAVGGDIRHHLFVGSDYELRLINGEGIKEVGFGYLLEQLEGPIIVDYNKLNGDFYIGNGTKTYLLSANGLSEIPQHPSALWVYEGQLCGTPEDVDDYEPLITTLPLDMGYKGNKTVFTMETDANGIETPVVGIDYINNLSDWYSTQYKPVNLQGIASIVISGNAFKFKLKASALTDDFRLGYIKARYKMTDLRGIRGVYAPPIRGQVAN